VRYNFQGIIVVGLKVLCFSKIFKNFKKLNFLFLTIGICQNTKILNVFTNVKINNIFQSKGFKQNYIFSAV